MIDRWTLGGGGGGEGGRGGDNMSPDPEGGRHNY